MTLSATWLLVPNGDSMHCSRVHKTTLRLPSRWVRSSTVTAGLLASLTAVLLACASTPDHARPSDSPSESPGSAEAPWRSGRLPVASVPEAYFTAWSRAENREACDLIAFVESAATEGATPRVATFSGGWGVAYDRPDLRSAFGVAGTGVRASDASYDEWPHRLTWSDGSSVGYGPEGGTGPNELAYLTIAGQQCLYNVWSRVSRAHLEQLLGSLRFVETSGELRP